MSIILATHSMHRLSLLTFWEQQFSPCLPLLADICHLSILHIRQALPDLLKIVCLQVNQLTEFPHSLFFDSEIAEGVIHDLSLNDILNSIEKHGMGFPQIHSLERKLNLVQEIMFKDMLQYQRILGILIDRTAIPVHKMQKLLDCVTFLSLISVYQMISKNLLSSDQLANLLSLQPFYHFDIKDEGLLSLYHHRMFNTVPNLVEETAIKQQPLFQPIFENPITLSLFCIAPFVHSHPSQKSNLLSPMVPFDHYNNLTTSDKPSIFTPIHRKPSIVKILQHYWMLTSMILTGLVFSVVAWFNSHSNEEKPVPPIAFSEHPIHDVAILKVDSSAATTMTAQSKTKLANKELSAKTSEKKPNLTTIKSDTKNKDDKNTKPTAKADAKNKNLDSKSAKKDKTDKLNNKKA